MKAVLFPAKGVADLVDKKLPELQPGQALVKVQASGLCQTDIDVLHGRYGIGSFPLVPGHEFSDITEAVGRGSAGVKVGDRDAIKRNAETGCIARHRRPTKELVPYFRKTGGDSATMKVQFVPDA